MIKGPIQSNYAYVTLITNDEYFKGVVILAESLRMVGSQYSLYCMVTPNVSQQTINNLLILGVFPIKVDIISLSEQLMEHNLKINQAAALGWKDCLTKFNVFKLTEFDKVIFCDADLLFLKNCDHCFDLPHMTAALDGEYSNVWPDWPHFNSGFLVIKPDLELYNTLVEFAATLDPKNCLYGDNQLALVTADQEILNLYYKDWAAQSNLHLSKYYNIFARHVSPLYLADIQEHGYFIHFVGQKPWDVTQFRTVAGDVDEEILASMLIHVSKFSTMSMLINYYEISYAIFQLSVKAKFHPLNWEQLLINGDFEAEVATVSLDVYKDTKTAQEYLIKALNKTSNINKYSGLQRKLSLYVKANRVAPILRNLFILMNFESNSDPLRYNQMFALTSPLFEITKYDDMIVPYTMRSIETICVIYDTIKNLIYSQFLQHNKVV